MSKQVIPAQAPTDASDQDELMTDLDEMSAVLEDTLFENFDDGLYIGMMSGTSLDGMDAVLCRFDNGSVVMIQTISQDFPPRLREVLFALSLPNGTSQLQAQASEPGFGDSKNDTSELDWLGWASAQYAHFAVNVVINLLEQADIEPEAILAIGCHGQTVRHRPQLGFSLQLLDPNILAERTGISVVSDFRRRDMAVGGQGAPLVPAFHHAMFGGSQPRVLLNLGGIANIAVLPADDTPVMGYDTGPANVLLDAWVSEHLGQAYDAGGAWAQSGTVIEPLLNQLLAHSFFSKPYPKSTGREAFNLVWLKEELQLFDKSATYTHYSPADVQATLTELTAISAADQINRFDDNRSEVFVCGGGAMNDYLITRLQAHLPHSTVTSTQTLGLAPTWVEATAFAWLARQTLMGQKGNLPAVTGAHKSVVLGQVCFA